MKVIQQIRKRKNLEEDMGIDPVKLGTHILKQ
jgi:hypothetical protein